jgi:hypothetical protein
MSPAERREFQRLRLHPALAGTFGSTPVVLLEIGVLGARLQHDEPLTHEIDDLHFGDGITLRSEVVRSVAANQVGVRFLSATGDSGDKLRTLLGDLVTKELAARPQVHSDQPQIDGDKTVRGTQAGYVCYRLDASGWSRRAVFLPEQPPVGFTVARSADAAELQRLCRVYQVSDEEGRRLIRLFAELSISEAMEIPPKA